MAVIFFFSSRPTAGVISADPTIRFYVFKSFHLIEYAFLAITVYYGAGRFFPALLLSYLYACTDEIHQRFTYSRTSKFTDTLIDLLGIIIGLFLYWALKKIKNHLH